MIETMKVFTVIAHEMSEVPFTIGTYSDLPKTYDAIKKYFGIRVTYVSDFHQQDTLATVGVYRCDPLTIYVVAHIVNADPIA